LRCIVRFVPLKDFTEDTISATHQWKCLWKTRSRAEE